MEEMKKQIDAMNYEQLLSKWRFAPAGDPFFQNEPELTANERRDIVLQGMTKSLPYLGNFLDTIVFGQTQELRMKRMEATLKEIIDKLNELGKKYEIHKEEFVNLFESVIPDLCRATNEEKRKYFRNLLFNASLLPPGSNEWDNANLSRQLLQNIDPTGLAILSAIYRCYDGQEGESLSIGSLPEPQVFKGHYERDAEGEVQIKYTGEAKHPIPFKWAVVYEWAQRLKEKRLIQYKESFSGMAYQKLSLTELGKFFINWTTSEEFNTE